MFGSFLSQVLKVSSQALVKQPGVNAMSTHALLTKPFINFHELKSALPKVSSGRSPLLAASQQLLPQITTQTRNSWGYKGRMMLKDIKRREMMRKFAPIRLRLQLLNHNNILPKVIRVFKKKKNFELCV